jgi:starch-binding outer membrane protein, SusD/RagB family
MTSKFKKMKKTIKLWLVLIPVCSSAVLVFNACSKSFLNNPPTGSLASSQLANINGLQGLLTGAYAALDGQGSGNTAIAGGNPWETAPDNWIYGSIAGGDNHKGSSLGDQPPIVPIATSTSNSSNGFFNDKWNAVYEGIARCNAVLATAKLATTVPAATLTEMEAEARFLRGHYYFELTKFWGKVPWIDENTTNFNQPNDSLRWPEIEADFTFAAANLPATQANVGQVNKWAANAYLAKAYVYEQKWAQAKTLLDQVVASGETSNGIPYALTARFEDNFDAAHKNNSESVFAIQQNANDGTNSIANANGGDMLNYPYNSPFRCCGFFQPTIDLANSYRTDANGLPLPTTYNNFPVKNDMNIPSTDLTYTPDAGNLDPRIDWTMGRRGLPFHDWGPHPGNNWIRDQASAGPYSNKKNIYWQYNAASFSDQSTWAPGNALNVNIIRFADVLLMDAEADAQTGDLHDATVLVNMVRTRAGDAQSLLYTYLDPTNPQAGFTTTPAANYVIGNYPSDFASQSAALTAIYFERKLELACEGGRFFDLVRWGIAAQTLNAFYAYEGAITDDLPDAQFTTGKNEVFPIPLNQLSLEQANGKSILTQNPGY